MNTTSSYSNICYHQGGIESAVVDGSTCRIRIGAHVDGEYRARETYSASVTGPYSRPLPIEALHEVARRLASGVSGNVHRNEPIDWPSAVLYADQNNIVGAVVRVVDR